MFIKYPFRFQVLSLIHLTFWALQIAQFFCSTITCPPPDFPEGGTYAPIKSEYEVGSRIFISCGYGLSLFGAYRQTCQTSGRWSGDTPFCDSPSGLNIPIASSKVESSESFAVDGNLHTCFRTMNGTGQSLTVHLDQPAYVYAVKIFFPKGKQGLNIKLFEPRNLPVRGMVTNFVFRKYLAENDWWSYILQEKNQKVGYLTIENMSSLKSFLSLCEIEVYARDGDEWCAHPPETVANGQLEVSRHKAVLICNEGFKAKDDRRVSAVCEKKHWVYMGLQCGVDKPEEDNNVLAVTFGTLIAIIILLLLGGFILLLSRRKNAREPTVVYKAGEANINSQPASVSGQSSTILPDGGCSTARYEEIQVNQWLPSAPPLESLNLSPKLDASYGEPVFNHPSSSSNMDNLLPYYPQLPIASS